MVISRKSNLFIFLVCLIVISVLPVTIAGVLTWDIQPDVFFRGSGGGPISFSFPSSATQIQIVNGVVEFTSLIVGIGTINFLGFNSSANANLTAFAVGSEMVVYNVDGPNGFNTTTIVKIPPDRTVRDVSGADSWSFNATSDLVTVVELHGAVTKQIMIYFNDRAGAISFIILAFIAIPAIFVMVVILRK